MLFPYGKAPFCILVLAVVSGIGVAFTHQRYDGDLVPDLVVATHARLHADIYEAKLPAFEAEHGVRVDVQVIDMRTHRARLLAAFSAGTDVPDVIEIPQDGSLFLRAPISEIGFLDLTDWVEERGLNERLVENRFSMWQRKGVTFAIPHDVHPALIAYRADIVEGELGIDVERDLTTWDDFARVAREKIVRDLDGDGTLDRFALELGPEGGDLLTLLMAQRDVDLFNEEDEVAFDTPEAAEVIMWAVRALYGPGRFANGFGYGQSMWQGMTDGAILFYMVPDWRTRNVEQYAPSLAGKMKLMKFPAWEPGGRRTSTWGSTGGAIAKRTKNPELAKKLLEYLYVDQSDGGEAAVRLHILPPLKEAWDLPAFNQESAYYSGQKIMQMFAEVANDTPKKYAPPFREKAEDKRNVVFLEASAYYREHGEDGFFEAVMASLTTQADYIRSLQKRTLIAEQ